MLARRPRAPSPVRDGFVVSASQGLGAVLRFAFQVALARAFAPSAVADVAVALSWSQVMAAASGGAGGTLLLTTLPRLVGQERERALPLYRGTTRTIAGASGATAIAVGAVLTLVGASGGTAAGFAILCTAPIRAALLTTQEALRAVGSLALSQVLTLVVQPAVSVAILGGAAFLTAGGADPRVAAVAIVMGLAVALLPGRTRLVKELEIKGQVRAIERPAPAPLLRYGVVSALLVWMTEGPLVLSALCISDRADLALLNAHIRLSLATALAWVVVSTVASSHWARRVREGRGLPSPRDALGWSCAGAAAAGLVAAGLFAVGRPILSAFGDAYTFSPGLLAGLVVKDVCLAAAAPQFYFLVVCGREAQALRAACVGGLSMLAVLPLAIVDGIQGAALGTGIAGLVWLGTHLVTTSQRR